MLTWRGALLQVPYQKFYFCFLVDGVIRAALDEPYVRAPASATPSKPKFRVRPRRRRNAGRTRSPYSAASAGAVIEVDKGEYDVVCAAIAAADAAEACTARDAGASRRTRLLAADGFLVTGGTILNVLHSKPEEDKASRAVKAAKRLRESRVRSPEHIFANARATLPSLPSWRGDETHSLEAAAAQTAVSERLAARVAQRASSSAVTPSVKSSGWRRWRATREQSTHRAANNISRLLAVSKVLSRLRVAAADTQLGTEEMLLVQRPGTSAAGATWQRCWL